MPKLIPVNDKEKLAENNIPFAPKTLYNWHTTKKYSQLFIRLAGKLFFDVSAWDRMVVESIEKRDKEIEGLKKRGVI